MVKPSGTHPDSLGLRSNPKISNLFLETYFPPTTA